MRRAHVDEGRPDWLMRLADPRDEEILAAAFDAFAAKGFHGTTMAEIAAAAGASKKTLYARYQDKAELFRALLAWGVRQNLPQALPEEDADPVAALHDHARAVMLAMFRSESLALFRVVIAEATRFPELAGHFDAMTRTASARIVERIAAALHARRLCRIDDVAQFSADFIGLLRADLFVRALLGVVRVPGERTLQRRAAAQMERLLRAYRL